jgi:choice-of-anchor B domain-containing protein
MLMGVPVSFRSPLRVAGGGRIPLAGLLATALIGAPATLHAQVPTRNLTLLSHVNEYPTPANGLRYAYSACWSYIHPDGREYAVLGVSNGTAIYNVTDPANPHRVGFIPGPFSIWRECKSYKTWIYIVTEGEATTGGVQIVRMTDPENPVLAATYATGFTHSHTVSVDTTRAILYCNGTRNADGQQTGMQILSILQPERPRWLGSWPAGAVPIPTSQYVHDCVPFGTRLYVASIYAGTERVLDVSDPTSPIEMSSWTYPGAHYTHNSWPDSTEHYLYVTDETNGQPLHVFDISDPNAPVLVNATITSNPRAIIHNVHVKGHELYASNYTEGIRVYDLSDPVHPSEFGWADSYPGVSGGYSGVWEVCPFFPSGIVIASDMQSGLYVYRPVRNFGLLRVRVVDPNGAPLPGVMVHLTTQGDSLATAADGIAQFAPSPGVHTVMVHSLESYDDSATRTVSLGSRDSVTLMVAPRPVVELQGLVRDDSTGLPLDAAEVSLRDSPFLTRSDTSGTYHLHDVPGNVYRLDVRRAGYAPVSKLVDLSSASADEDVRLKPAAWYDALESDRGWTVGDAGDDASPEGVWTRVTPRGTGPHTPGTRARPALPPMRLEHEEPPATDPGNAAPYFDHTPGAGTMCFVTGQGSDTTNSDEADVDNGHTTLTSPSIDISGMKDPTVGYWRWFYSWSPGTGQPDPDDYLLVYVRGDHDPAWVPVETVRGAPNTWTEHDVRLKNVIVSSPHVRIRFVAADLGDPTIVEAAVDDIAVYDSVAGTVTTPPPTSATLQFARPQPNPSFANVRLELELPVEGEAHIEVLDLSGRRVRTLWNGPAAAGRLPLDWDGTDAGGRRVPAGVYYARARTTAGTTQTRFVRLE